MSEVILLPYLFLGVHDTKNSNVKKKKILILGGKGFVGKIFYRKLIIKKIYHCTSRRYFSSNAKIILGDLTSHDEKILSHS